jgi:hypothetical protein
MPDQYGRLTIEETVLLLIDSIENALRSGTKHFNAAGELLTTPLEVLVCLKTEGAVTFKPPISEKPK